MLHVLNRKVFALVLFIYTTYSFAEYPETWDLRSSIEEAYLQAPQLQASKARIEARQIQLDEAGTWPNPRVLVGANNKVSLEQGSNGYELNNLDILQPLPIGRLGAEKKQASIVLNAAQSKQRLEFLKVEKETAYTFYTLQYNKALLRLSEQRHESLEKLLSRGEDPLVRFVTKTERKRLDILREQAHQAVAAAEGEYRETVSQFRALLNLPEKYQPITTSLKLVPTPQKIEQLLESQTQHPLLMSLQQSKLAAEAGIDVARATRRVDPELLLFSERDVYAGRVQVSTGIGILVEMPFWNSSDHKVAQARAEYYQQQAELKNQQNNLDNNLHKNHFHLQHLIEQANHYRDFIIVPAREILDLSQRGFRSGEIDILNFIDAHNTYYDAQANYLKLLHKGWLETAELRYSTGQLLSEVSQ